MSRRGENIYRRKDGRWEGRYVKSHENGRFTMAMFTERPTEKYSKKS